MGVDMQLLRRRGAGSEGTDSGEASLNKLGYKQELSRGFGFINNAAMSFRSASSLLFRCAHTSALSCPSMPAPCRIVPGCPAVVPLQVLQSFCTELQSCACCCFCICWSSCFNLSGCSTLQELRIFFTTSQRLMRDTDCPVFAPYTPSVYCLLNAWMLRAASSPS